MEQKHKRTGLFYSDLLEDGDRDVQYSVEIVGSL